MTVNDGELETDLPIALFGSTIPAALGSVICLILMCTSSGSRGELPAEWATELQLDASLYGSPSSGTCPDWRRMRFFIIGRWFWWGSSPVLSLSGHADRRLPCRCFYSGKKVQTRCEVLFRVIVALTGEWAVKPRGCRFMDHLVLSKGKGQGCTTCPPQYLTVEGGPWTVKHVASNYRVEQA